MILSFGNLSVFSVEFYVAIEGNDEYSGTRQKPFKTVTRAVTAAQEFFQQNKNDDCFIWLNAGDYVITNPLELNSAELKIGNGHLYFRSVAEEEKPLISGGKKVTGWIENSDGLWEAEVSGPEKIRELFMYKKRLIRARHPNNGYLRVKKVGDDRRTHFYFDEGDFPITKESDLPELVLLHDWSVSRIQVDEIDEEQNKLTAVDSIGARNPAFFNLDNWEPDPRYFLENSKVFLDNDYEWYFDEKSRTVFLQLPDDLNPNDLNIFVPVSEGIIKLTGNENKPLKNVHFEGISFKHSAWKIPEKGYAGVQACHFDSHSSQMGWSVVPAAVKAVWTENCSFSNCTFENLGGSGVWFGTGAKNCRIENSSFFDISGNGIMIGEGRDRKIDGETWYEAAPEQVALGNLISNCKIIDCGAQFFGAVGIWCGLTAETTIRNNEIYDLPYTGVSIGWMWNPQPTPCRDNTIEGNHIHHIMQTLSDGGGIYMLGLQPGSKLIGNRIHDVQINAGRAESNGMFLDEGTTDVVVAENLIYNIAKSPLRFHRATTNLVKENYLFCTEDNPPIRYNTTEEADIKKVKNKVYHQGDENYPEALEKAIEEWE
ncbi:right-handed parallel beta-helix repeat-containing protein [Tangfeifania diversioriginum]|nr:right-handed parallel beta-helix repeat-containing protein [Tangfeifania diversioriginum]